MAKQVGPLYYEGTLGDIIFYQVNGQYYARFKGTYKSRKQMQRIPKYKRTLHYARQFGKTSSLASWVYQRYLPEALRKQGVFGKFSGKATRLRHSGKSDKEIKEALIEYCEQLTQEAAAAKQATITQDRPSIKKDNSSAKQARYLPSPAPKKTKVKGSLFAIPSPPNRPILTTHNSPLTNLCHPPND